MNYLQVDFELDKAYVNTYYTTGSYLVKANVSNRINTVEFNCTLDVLVPVVNFQMTVSSRSWKEVGRGDKGEGHGPRILHVPVKQVKKKMAAEGGHIYFMFVGIPPTSFWIRYCSREGCILNLDYLVLEFHRFG